MKIEELKVVKNLLNPGENRRHPKCKSYQCNHYLDPVEYNCEYQTTLDCDECKYNGRGGTKNPEAKCNQ
jgi:hypothetical protein